MFHRERDRESVRVSEFCLFTLYSVCLLVVVVDYWIPNENTENDCDLHHDKLFFLVVIFPLFF